MGSGALIKSDHPLNKRMTRQEQDIAAEKIYSIMKRGKTRVNVGDRALGVNALSYLAGRKQHGTK